MSRKENFLKVTNHNELAIFFGLSYAELSKIIYKTSSRYRHFEIPKKKGGVRKICSPSKKLKYIQTELKDVLYEIYPGKPTAHGFSIGKSIVTNAERHLDKKYVFNIDLENFFGSIHFGRVRNLFKSNLFGFNHAVSTILAQICCFENSLPQGAPTSPILSNMIAWKLDSQLQRLAKLTNSTYTRYCDDISFSFTCGKSRLPKDIVVFDDDKCTPGLEVTHIIEANGFSVNYDKVRLHSRFSKMEVTGLTVNEFVNVRRRYIRQISSILNAWRKYGYDAAQKDFNELYPVRHRASGKPKSLLFVIKGKLSFLRSVRGSRDRIFNKLGSKFNSLVEEKYQFKLIETTDPERNAIEALWVIEACYDGKNGEVKVFQGSGFQLDGVGIVTCAHVVSDKDEVFSNLEAYKHSDPGKKFQIKVERICRHRDIAICRVYECEGDKGWLGATIEKGKGPVLMGGNVKLLGFPAYAPGHGYYMVDSKIAKIYVQSGVHKFEISSLIREGNSGGPIIDLNARVVGIALEGARKDGGNNGCLLIDEIDEVLSSDKYKI